METAIIIGVIIAIGLIFAMSNNKKTRSVKNEVKIEHSANGIYLINNSSITPLINLPEEGSINSIKRMLGYTQEQTHTVIDSNLKTVNFIVIEKSSMKPIFFEMKDKSITPSHTSIANEIKNVNWNLVKMLIE